MGRFGTEENSRDDGECLVGEGRCGGERSDGGEGEGGVECKLKSGLEMVVAVGSGLEMVGDGQRWCGGWRNGWVGWRNGWEVKNGG
uniref:Uncharacterized protein n=1 Tax=Tanacetum cinerariifolium TaxID=118510 RepID=A0A699K564_TANCI|nr:hypothetical protein [Tanacetum cinerariifolium]